MKKITGINILWNLPGIPPNDRIASLRLRSSLPEIGAWALSSFSSPRTWTLASLSHVSVHTQTVGGTGATLPSCILFLQEFATLLNASLLHQIPLHWLKHSSKVSTSYLFIPKYAAHRAKGQERQRLCICFCFFITAAFHLVIHPRVTVSGLRT